MKLVTFPQGDELHLHPASDVDRHVRFGEPWVRDPGMRVMQPTVRPSGFRLPSSDFLSSGSRLQSFSGSARTG